MSSTPERGQWADKHVFTTGEAAEVCGVSQQTIIRCFDSGRLEGFRVPGSRFRRIPRQSLIAFMRSNALDPTPLLDEARRVAIISGDSAYAEILRGRLARDSRNDVHVISSAWEGGLFVGRRLPGIVVLDGAMAGLDPAAAAVALRRSEVAEVRLVVLLDRPTAATERALREAGVSHILDRPHRAEDLVERIEDLLVR